MACSPRHRICVDAVATSSPYFEAAPEGVGQDLEAHAVPLALPRAVRSVGGNPVDRQQGAVKDDKCLHPDGLFGGPGASRVSDG